MKFIIGKKIEMTQVWKGERVFPVTKIKAGPCTVVQVKNSGRDGYESVQLGYESKKDKHTAKPQKGHFGDLGNFRYLREFRTDTDQAGKGEARAESVKLKRGDVIEAASFQAGDIVKISGTSKGKGFQGVVKRHGFHGQDKTHGTKDQVRMPGSIGSTGPQRVFKGVRMPGRMGNEKVTTANLEIIGIDSQNGIIFIKGAVPGARNSLVLICGEGEIVLARSGHEATQSGANEEQADTANPRSGAEETAEEPLAAEENKPGNDQESLNK